MNSAHLGVHTLAVPSELTTEDLSELQREDPIISPLLDFLDRDVNPTRDDLTALPLESSKLWSQRPLIHVRDGIIVRDVHKHNS